MSHANTFKFALLASAFAFGLTAFHATTGLADSGLQVADSSQGQGQGGQGQGGQGQGGQGQGGQGDQAGQGHHGKSLEDAVFGEDSEDEDSDRPEWAGTPGKENKPGKGNQTPGVSKGSLYGDLYVVLRDENGLPILDENGNVQPILLDGTVVQLTPEGDLPVEYTDLVQPVDFGRLNVGRAPWHVLDSRYSEVVDLLNDPTLQSVSLDASGRIVVTLAEVAADGTTTLVEKTIDAPLENLAIYVALMNSGTLEGVNLTADQLGTLSYLTDGQLTGEDITAAASFLAASADKGEEFTTDLIVYYNLILKVTGTDPVASTDGTLYYDFTDFTYDRASVYDGQTASVLVLQSDGTWKVETVDIYSTLFNDTNYTSDGGIDGFTQATADANLVIDFLHEYAVPVTTSSTATD